MERLVLDLAEVVAGAGNVAPAEDLHRLGRPGVLDRLAVLVLHRADPAVGGAGDQRVADLEAPLLDEHRRDRPTALVEVRLEHRAARVPGRIAFEVLEVRHDEDRFE